VVAWLLTVWLFSLFPVSVLATAQTPLQGRTVAINPRLMVVVDDGSIYVTETGLAGDEVGT
jgi:hypothetical protein